MRIQLTILAFLLFKISSAVAQEYDHNKVELLGHWQQQGLRYSSCWGYEENGRQYAIVGGSDGTYYVDITNTDSLKLVDFTDSPIKKATWREYKTYGKYLYAVSDDSGPNVMQIVDLSFLPDSVHIVYEGQDYLRQGHTIFIEGDYLYVGIRRKPGKTNAMTVFDLKEDPTHPKELRSLEDDGIQISQVHDMFVRNDTIYASCGYDGLYIFTFKDNKFKAVGSYTDYPFAGYNHSSILSPDGKTLIFTDEVPGSLPAKSIDVSDVSNPTPLDTFYSQSGKATLHNPFLINSRFFVMASYLDGMQVFDYSNPKKIKLTGYFDTYYQIDGSATTGDYDGVWSVYPWLSNGNIIAVDMKNGLYVLDASAAYDTSSIAVKRDVGSVGDVRIYPNPTQGEVRFTLPSDYRGEATFKMMSTAGQQVNQWKMDVNANQLVRLELPLVANGNYILTIAIKNKKTLSAFINLTK
ncbi:MAG TPA: choice-of-anchor B family protein [Saprospiraceae bacterium]|nr:choice-of-anchor B family protein [Saprospiraceae bacterium]HQW55751.1 choice-of-anchor B family protein [Saprospiraceae bacterium]